jgi:hypothetical protein
MDLRKKHCNEARRMYIRILVPCEIRCSTDKKVIVSMGRSYIHELLMMYLVLEE